MSMFLHEHIYRTPAVMEKFKAFPITICGAGALGANITETLARSGFQALRVIDYDRVEEHNLSTQPYYRSEVGGFKAKVLANNLYRALGVEISPNTQKLTSDNAMKLLKGSQLVIDAFDNSSSRQTVTDTCAQQNWPCLHAGLATDYAEVIWNAHYRVPSASREDVCDYPLARNLVMLTVAIASEVVMGYAATGEQRNFTITLKDLSVEALIV